MEYWVIAIATIAVIIVVALSVFLTRKYIRNFTEKRIAEYQNDLITKHCEEVQNIYKTMRGWRHDYKNHIQVMRASLEMGNLTELGNYLGELSVDLNTVDTVIKTGNVMADAILNSKLALCKVKNIPYDVTANIPEACSVNDVELCAIIGNLLDNAMEACEKIEDKSERFIRVYIGLFKEQLYINVTNSMTGTPVKKGKAYKSSKGENHGFGLMRVDRIAGKYNGFVNRQFEDGVFGTEIMLACVGAK
ncbi:MAG: GHKL domain-containing protein [Clostridia bacterium]|nr:GHKL domain-containing protein [Clostridia bacterium]